MISKTLLIGMKYFQLSFENKYDNLIIVKLLLLCRENKYLLPQNLKINISKKYTQFTMTQDVNYRPYTKFGCNNFTKYNTKHKHNMLKFEQCSFWGGLKWLMLLMYHRVLYFSLSPIL